MNQEEQLIMYGIAFINALSNLEEDHPETVSPIISMLDCVHPDPEYHLGIYIEEPSPFEAVTHRCDQSWFHCYQGPDEPIVRRQYDNYKWKDGDSENMLFLRFTFEMFLHLNIDYSIMGAWQAYLLSISKTLLPFSGHLYYTKRKLIFTHEQLPKVWVECEDSIDDKLEQVKYKGNVAPSILIKGNECTISCCYWSKWRGLIREKVNISFMDNGKVKIGDFSHQTLYEYDCGVRY